MLQNGLYEALINQIYSNKLSELDKERYFVNEVLVDKAEAANILSNYTIQVIHHALNLVKGKDALEDQIRICNKIIELLKNEIKNEDFDDSIIEGKGRVLTAIFDKLDSSIADFSGYLNEITPQSGLIQSELFTGSNVGISMESEIKKEILSSDTICFLVSFIKWTGIRIFEKELRSSQKEAVS